MFSTKAVCLALFYVLFSIAPARATEYFDLGLHGRVHASDIIVLARVVDRAMARVNIERVLKGEAPKQITLVTYLDGFAAPAQRKPLMAAARELLFLTKKGDAYAPSGSVRPHGREPGCRIPRREGWYQEVVVTTRRNKNNDQSDRDPPGHRGYRPRRATALSIPFGAEGLCVLGRSDLTCALLL
jgi:hypothetical protein